jgi:hypothetical protein
MSAVGLLARRFAADYARNGVNALVLVLVPATFVVVAAGSLGDAASRLGGNAAAVATVTAGWAAGFVSAVGMYFLVAGNRAPDRRLLISGLPHRTLVMARSVTGLLVAAVAAAAAVAALALRSGIDNPGRAVLGTIMFALVYAAIGALIAVLLPDPVNGVIAVLFVWIIDVFFGPALTGSARSGTRFLPTHYLSLWLRDSPPATRYWAPSSHGRWGGRRSPSLRQCGCCRSVADDPGAGCGTDPLSRRQRPPWHRQPKAARAQHSRAGSGRCRRQRRH